MTEKRPTTWKKGQSGNPAGRPPTVEKVRKLLEPRRKELVDVAVAQALAGDMSAMRIVMDRLAPPLRAVGECVAVPGLAEATTMTDKAMAIYAAVGNGQINPDSASLLLTALAAVAKVVETDQLAARIQALEDNRP